MATAVTPITLRVCVGLRCRRWQTVTPQGHPPMQTYVKQLGGECGVGEVNITIIILNPKTLNSPPASSWRCFRLAACL